MSKIILFLLLSVAAWSQMKPTENWEHSGFVSAEYLYWLPQESGLAYAIQTVQEDAFAKKGNVRNIDFEWDSGLRLGAGYRMPHDRWELSAHWLRFTPSASGRTTSLTTLIFPEWAPQIVPDMGHPVTYINGRWDLHLNVVDGEIARYFMVTDWLSFKPRFGIVGAWINQEYNSNLNGGTETIRFTTVVTDSIKIQNDFTGVGLKGGLDTEWTMWCHWSLYSNAAFSLLYGNFHVRQMEHQSTTTALSSHLISDISDSFHNIAAIADLAVGLRFDYEFCSCALTIDAGWEFMDFFGQNHFMHVFNPANSFAFSSDNGDLTMQGFVFSGRIDF